MTNYLDYLTEVLDQDLRSGRRQYGEHARDAVMGWLESSDADDKLPELLLALMDRLDTIAGELTREKKKTQQLNETLCRMSDRQYRLEKRIEVERSRRVHA